MDTSQRDLESRLHQNHLHLNHLIGQADHYERALLKPSARLFELARRSFRAGEQNVLTLVDANSTWFEAQSRYNELLHDAWREAADLRLAAGLSYVGGGDPSSGPSGHLLPVGEGISTRPVAAAYEVQP
jgi:outer membrane protein TolC